jgi:hypothetical protein
MTAPINAKQREKFIRAKFLRVKQLAQQDYRTCALTNAKGFELLRSILDILRMLPLLQLGHLYCVARSTGFSARRSASVTPQLQRPGPAAHSSRARRKSAGKAATGEFPRSSCSRAEADPTVTIPGM